MSFSRAVRAGLALAALATAGCANSGGADPNGAVYDAWRAQRSHVEVTARGSVALYLGVRSGPSGEHEGFLLHLSGSSGRGLTVKVEDNTDITGPIPLRPGDAVEVRGEYIYTSLGGLIHYTHHDPRFRHAGGYVSVAGKMYR
jgi:hypothetical protein